MRNTLKKALSLLLAVVMVMGLGAFSVLAADEVAAIGETEYTTFEAALSAANADSDIVLKTSGDYTVTSSATFKTLTIGEGVTASLTVESGATLTGRILNQGNLTILGSGSFTSEDVDNPLIENQGTMVIGDESTKTGPEFTYSTYSNESASGIAQYNLRNRLIFNGWFSTPDTSSGAKGYYDSSYCDVSTKSDVNLTINGGTFRGGQGVVENSSKGYLTINGGTFYHSYKGVPNYDPYNATAPLLNLNIASIHGGTFESRYGAAVVISRGKVLGEGVGNDPYRQGDLTITGGVFKRATALNGAAHSSSSSADAYAAAGSYCIEGVGNVQNFGYVGSASDFPIVISGGTFYNAGTDFVANQTSRILAGYEAVTNDNGSSTVQEAIVRTYPVWFAQGDGLDRAKELLNDSVTWTKSGSYYTRSVTEEQVTTLLNAGLLTAKIDDPSGGRYTDSLNTVTRKYNAYNAGEKITILRDCEFSSTSSFGKYFTLDLNGHTITATSALIIDAHDNLSLDASKNNYTRIIDSSSSQNGSIQAAEGGSGNALTLANSGASTKTNPRTTLVRLEGGTVQGNVLLSQTKTVYSAPHKSLVFVVAKDAEFDGIVQTHNLSYFNRSEDESTGDVTYTSLYIFDWKPTYTDEGNGVYRLTVSDNNANTTAFTNGLASFTIGTLKGEGSESEISTTSAIKANLTVEQITALTSAKNSLSLENVEVGGLLDYLTNTQTAQKQYLVLNQGISSQRTQLYEEGTLRFTVETKLTAYAADASLTYTAQAKYGFLTNAANTNTFANASLLTGETSITLPILFDATDVTVNGTKYAVEGGKVTLSVDASSLKDLQTYVVKPYITTTDAIKTVVNEESANPVTVSEGATIGGKEITAGSTITAGDQAQGGSGNNTAVTELIITDTEGNTETAYAVVKENAEPVVANVVAGAEVKKTTDKTFENAAQVIADAIGDKNFAESSATVEFKVVPDTGTTVGGVTTYNVDLKAIVNGEEPTAAYTVPNSALSADAAFDVTLNVPGVENAGTAVQVTHTWDAYTNALGKTIPAGSKVEVVLADESGNVTVTVGHFSSFSTKVIRGGINIVYVDAQGNELTDDLTMDGTQQEVYMQLSYVGSGYRAVNVSVTAPEGFSYISGVSGLTAYASESKVSGAGTSAKVHGYWNSGTMTSGTVFAVLKFGVTNGDGSKVFEIASASYCPDDPYSGEVVVTDNGTATVNLIGLFTVSFNGNNEGATGTMAPVTRNRGTEIKLPANLFERTGFDFIGWATVEGGTTVAYEEGDTYTFTNNDATLYAVWQLKKYTITYDANGGTGTIADGTKTHDEPFTLSDGKNGADSLQLTRDGYRFVGWNTAADGNGTDYAFGGSYTGNANLELYAKWAPLYTVTINLGVGVTGPIVGAGRFIEGEEVTVGATLNSVGYKDLVFTDADSESPVTVSSNQFSMPARNVVLNATATAKTVAITAGDGATGDGNAAYDSPYTATGLTSAFDPKLAYTVTVTYVEGGDDHTFTFEAVEPYTVDATGITLTADAVNELVASNKTGFKLSVSSEVAGIKVNVYEYLSGYALVTVTSTQAGNTDAYDFYGAEMYADSLYSAATEGIEDNTNTNTVFAYLIQLKDSVLEGVTLTDEEGRTDAAEKAIAYVSVHSGGEATKTVRNAQPVNFDVNKDGAKDMMDVTLSYQGILLVIGEQYDVTQYMDIYLAADVVMNHALDTADTAKIYSEVYPGT